MDKLSKEQMINYLEYALQLEGSAYAANEMIEQLRAKANSLGNHNEYIAPPKKFKFMDFWDVIISCLIIELIGFIIGAVVILTLGLPQNLIIIVIIVLPIIRIYSEYSERNQKKEEYQRKVQQQNELNAQELKLKRELEQKINALNNRLREIIALLGKFYSPNIIFVKYRNLIAVAQILEYYKSGRRDCLEGKDGAYDLFEYEKTQKTIIYELRGIRNQLNMLQFTQSMLLGELRMTNNMLSSINGELSRLNSTMNSVGLDSHIAIYDAMVTARQRNANNYMDSHRDIFW